MMRSVRTQAQVTAFALAAAIGAGQVQAGGFALTEQGASGIGNAFAGASALGEDATTVFFNPAGMSRLKNFELSLGGSLIRLDTKFTGTATNPAAMGGGSATGGSGGDAGGTAAVPHLYLVAPVGDRIRLGLGVSVPFGLKTEYDGDWVGRFQGIKSELRTINVNPAISWAPTDTLSVAVGVNYQTIDTELTNAVVLGAGVAGTTKLKADDSAWGWNAGVMWQAAPATRLGFSYRSGLKYGLSGDITTTNAAGGVVGAASGSARADIELPSIWSVGLVQGVTADLDLLAEATYTHWSVIDQIVVTDSATGGVRDILALEFDNTWRYAVGANYRLSDTLMLRAGVAYDQSPVKSAQTRTVRLPDADRTWLALGLRIEVCDRGVLDVGYAHLFVRDADIAFTRGQLVPGTTTVNPATATTMTGGYSTSVDVLSVQYNQRF
jgi:long-chain fatty acid transport protein